MASSSTEQALYVHKEWAVGGGHIKKAVHYEACDTEEIVDENGDRHVFVKLCKSDNRTQRLIFGASSTSCGMALSQTTIIEQISQTRDMHRSQLIEKKTKEAADQELQKHQDAMHGKVDASVDDAASTIDSIIAPKRGEKRKVTTRLSLPKYITFMAPPMYTREAAQTRANVDDPYRFLARDKLFDGVEISCKICQDPERQSMPSLWLECTASVIDYLHRFAVEEAERGVHVVHPRSSGAGRDSSPSRTGGMTGLSRVNKGRYEGYFMYHSPHFRDNRRSIIPTKDREKAVELVHEMLSDDTLPAGFPPHALPSDMEVSDSANESDESVALESMVDAVPGSMVDESMDDGLVPPGRPDPTSPASSTPLVSESNEFYTTCEAYTQAKPEKGGDGRKFPVGRNKAATIENLD